MLALLQFVVAFLSSRSTRAAQLLTAGPSVVLRHGTFDEAALRRSRLSEADVLAAIRASGTGSVETVAAVVLEANGTLSVVQGDRLGSASAFAGLAL